VVTAGRNVPLFHSGVMMAFGRGLLLNQMRVPIDVDLPSHPTRAIRIAQIGPRVASGGEASTS
jgi:hypothetical protein